MTDLRTTCLLIVASLLPGLLPAQDSVKERLVSGAADVASQYLAESPRSPQGHNMVAFGLLLDERNQRLHELQALADQGVKAKAPATPVAPDDYARLLRDIAARDRVAERQLVFYAVAEMLAPGDEQAKAVIAKAEAAGVNTKVGALLAASGAPTSDAHIPEFKLSERADYITPLQTLRRALFGGNIGDQVPVTEDSLKKVGGEFVRRKKADEEDRKLADLALRVMSLYVDALREREQLREKFEAAGKWEPAIKRVEGALYEQELQEGRQMRQGNVRAEWERQRRKTEDDVVKLIAELEAEGIALDRRIADHQALVASRQEAQRIAYERRLAAERAREDKEREKYYAQLRQERGDDGDDAAGGGPRVVYRVPLQEKQVYDPTPAATPAPLRLVVKETANWLVAQARRSGGNLASRIYARDFDGRAVLYLHVSEVFMAQDFEVQLQTAEGIQRFWAQRCATNRKARKSDSYLVLVNPDGKVFAASSLKKAHEIWMK